MRAPTLPPIKQPVKLGPVQPIVQPVLFGSDCVYAHLPIESSGSRIPDYSGKNRHGNPVGTVWKTTSRRGPALEFNGTTGRINTGSKWAETGEYTFIFSHWPKGWGGSNAGTIISNGKLWIFYVIIQLRLIFSSDYGVTSAYMSQPTKPDGSYRFHAFVRSAAGLVNIYEGRENTAPTRQGAANQDGGTPVAATTNLFIGNVAAGTFGYDGKMGGVLVYNRQLTLPEITLIWEWFRR